MLQARFEMLGSFNSVAIPLAGMFALLLAYYAVFRNRRPAFIAACLTVAPLPLIVGLHAALDSQIDPLIVLSKSAVTTTTAQIAEGVAAALLPLEAGLFATWPALFLLSGGLIFHTWRSDTPPVIPNSVVQRTG